MASFKREQALVRYLLGRLHLGDAATSDPNVSGTETGVDVTVRLANLRTIGVQVTELDPYAVPARRAARRRLLQRLRPIGRTSCGGRTILQLFSMPLPEPSRAKSELRPTIRSRDTMRSGCCFAGASLNTARSFQPSS